MLSLSASVTSLNAAAYKSLSLSAAPILTPGLLPTLRVTHRPFSGMGQQLWTGPVRTLGKREELSQSGNDEGLRLRQKHRVLQNPLCPSLAAGNSILR